MSIQFLEEHTRRIPTGSPLRASFDAALVEIDAMRDELEELREKAQQKKKASSKIVEPTVA